jgi:hypothetical protein
MNKNTSIELLIVTAAIILTSCVTKLDHESASATTTVAATKIPEPTFTMEIHLSENLERTFIPTQTPGDTYTPEYASEFAAGGYNSMETEPGSQHVIVYEASLEYAPIDEGILYNGLRIFSWFNNVAYFGKDGQYHHGILLNNTCVVGGENDGRFTSALTDGSQVTPNRACPGMPFFQGQNRDLLKVLPGDYQILKAFFGTGHDSNKDLIYGSVFFGLTTPADTLSIPGIGDNVLPITFFKLPDPPID